MATTGGGRAPDAGEAAARMYVGIDVAKATLDVWVDPAGRGWTTTNDAPGLAELVARVQALAEPGEVLVTGTVRDALLGADLVFVPRGRRGLRGLPGRWSLYRIGAA